MSENPVNNFSKNLRKLFGIKTTGNNSLKSFEFILLSALFFLLLIFAYSNHFHNPFHFDDDHTIVSNQSIRTIKNIPNFFTDATTTSSLPANQSYRPGLTTLNTIDYWIGGEEMPNPFYFHLSIFISFVLLGIFLFMMIYKIFNMSVEHKWNKYFALFATGFFMLHTANAETINYIIQRAESFSTLMVILSFVIYMYFPLWRKYYLYVIPMIIGFFVKEPALMFAPLLFIFILLFEKMISLKDSLSIEGRKSLKTLLTLVPALIAGVLLFYLSQKMTSSTWDPGGGRGWVGKLIYLQTQTFVVVHYFTNFLFPFNLSADTDWTLINSITDERVIIGTCFIIALLIIAFITSKKQITRPISFGILWFFIALLPTSSIFPFSEVLNDHRAFFPYIGLCIALVWSVAIFLMKFSEWGFIKKPVEFCLLIGISILVLHSVGVRTRNKVWSSGENLWYDVTIKSPNNPRGLMNYGNVLMAQAKWDDALSYFNRAKQIWPQYSYIYVNIGVLYGATNNPTEAENNFKYALQLNPLNPGSYFYYANWLKRQGRIAEAKKLLSDGLKISPNSVELLNLGKELATVVENNSQQIISGNTSTLDQAIIKASNNPSPENYLKLSEEFFISGKFEKCIEAAQEALKINSKYDLAYNNICAAYNAIKEWDKAIEAGEKGLKINANNGLIKGHIAIAKQGKGQK